MNDQFFMLEALKQAQIRRGFCSPNPSVGAVIVKNGEMLGKGHHVAVGFPHAEIEALNNAGPEARGATLYVTLEPCCHMDKLTPPCTNAIKAIGIKHLIYGVEDPNPKVAGKGIENLKSAGIVCEKLEIPDISKFYSSYAHWLKSRMPFVTGKLAITLDGKTAGPHGVPLHISGSQATQFTHEMRKKSDAILTTSKTIISDNPRLNVRLKEGTFQKPIYVLDSQLRLPLDSRIFETAKSIVLLHSDRLSESRKSHLLEKHICFVEVPPEKGGLDLPKVLSYIAAEGIHDLWVEAGGTLLRALVSLKLMNRLFLIIAPYCLGGESSSVFEGITGSLFTESKQVRWSSLGKDGLCELGW